MKSTLQDAFDSGVARKTGLPDEVDTGESTLRLVARLRAPEGLEERVLDGLRSRKTTGRLLAWPVRVQPTAEWKRGAAAAAIALIVIGGGWGIYAHVQPRTGGAIPARPGVGAGFSSAGAVRTPHTLVGPVAVPTLEEAPHPLAVPVRKAAPAASVQEPAAAARNVTAKPSQAVPGQPSVTVAR